MKRQFDYTVMPGPNSGLTGGGTCASNWNNRHVLERYGDDNTVYFTDVAEQLLIGSGPAPIDLPSVGQDNTNRKYIRNVLPVLPGDTVTSFLCGDSENVKRTFLLGPKSTVKIFIDAWESWQTVPLYVTVESKKETRVPYKWKLYNYLPMGNMTGTSGEGFATICQPLAQQPPIIRTLGSTSRAPNGEYPVSKETKNRMCHCERDRPFLVFSNDSDRASLEMSIKIAM